MEYLEARIKIVFSDAPDWGNPPSFVFRSVLGMSLRRLVCVLRNQKTCSDCLVKDTCIYSVFFETNIEKDNKALSGRNKGIHPFVFDYQCISEMEALLSIVFIGKAINYAPYVTMALENAGRIGVGRSRTRYTIDSIKINGKDMVQSVSFFENNKKTWPRNDLGFPRRIILETPCRIKEQGRYLSHLPLESMIQNMKRRISILNELFCNNEPIPEFDIGKMEIESRIEEQHWIDKKYYSSRQSALLRLGGVIGSIEILQIDEISKLYLDAMEVFNVGKNISFGFGKVRVEYDE